MNITDNMRKFDFSLINWLALPGCHKLHNLIMFVCIVVLFTTLKLWQLEWRKLIHKVTNFILNSLELSNDFFFILIFLLIELFHTRKRGWEFFFMTHCLIYYLMTQQMSASYFWGLTENFFDLSKKIQYLKSK